MENEMNMAWCELCDIWCRL